MMKQTFNLNDTDSEQIVLFQNKQKLCSYLWMWKHSVNFYLKATVYVKYCITHLPNNCMPYQSFSQSQELAVRAMVLHGEQLHRVPLGGRFRLHPHGALHRPLHRHRLPSQAQNVEGQC